MPRRQTTITVELPVVLHYSVSKRRPATWVEPEEPAQLTLERVELCSPISDPNPDGTVYLLPDYWEDQQAQLEQDLCEHEADRAEDYPEPDDR